MMELKLKYQKFSFDLGINFVEIYGSHEPYNSIFRTILTTKKFYTEGKTLEGMYYTYSEDSSTETFKTYEDIKIELENAVKEACIILDHYHSIKGTSC